LVLFVVGILPSCTDEVKVHLDAPLEKPLIYCILNPTDSVQYMRVQRIFLGNQDVRTMASQPDSIYFSKVQAQLERLEGGLVHEILPFYPTTSILKDSGFFTTLNHIIYEVKKPIYSGATYNLIVTIDGIPNAAIAVTTPQTDLKVVTWNGWPGKSINMVNQSFSQVIWKSLPGVNSYELSYLFRYYDLSDQDTVEHQITWKVPDKISAAGTAIGDDITYEVPISQWFLFLADHIPNRPEVKRRIAGKFDLLWEYKGAAFEDFYGRNLLRNKEMWLDYALFSNITDAIGIFSFQSCYRADRIDISLYTLERITTHPLTKDLKFDARVSW